MDQVISTIKKTIKQRGAWVAAGAIILVAIIYLVFTLPTAGLTKPIREQIAAIQIEDNVTAYSYTSAAFQKATSLNAFVNFINQYSGLRNNDSIKIHKREIKNGIGIVKATLISRSGMETPVIYQLVDEKDRWKIESIIITPQGDYDASAISNAASSASNTPATPPATTPAAAPTAVNAEIGTHTYQDPSNKYSLIYPDEWQYNKAEDKIIFNGKPGSVSSQSSLTIQPLSTASEQGVQEVADQEEAQLKDSTSSFKVVEDGLLPPRSNKNENYHGKYVVYSYTLNDQPMKQLQVIYFKSPKRAQYIIDFVAPESQFETDLPAAKAMIASFTIS